MKATSRFFLSATACVALTAFIPMLMDTGGNSGSQASVTVIRALSLDELGFRDLPKVIWKELQTAALCGGTLGVACFGKIYLVDKLLMGNADLTVGVILVVCLTMVLTVVVAKLIGCSLPMLAKKLGFDPLLVIRTGDDGFAGFAKGYLAENGVDQSIITSIINQNLLQEMQAGEMGSACCMPLSSPT